MILPVLSPEYRLDYNLQIHSIDTGDWCKYIVATNYNKETGNFDYFVPSLGMRSFSKDLEFVTTFNRQDKHFFYHPVQMGVKYHIRIQQTYTGNGSYQYTVFMDGVKIHTALNNNAQQFHNLHVYMTRSIDSPCNATVSKFKITNFL
uniref:Uncharacterized protein n=2 Tax=Clytia hemisphaerica TaxID=252671 RepID=A0A7M5WWU4_9CNID